MHYMIPTLILNIRTSAGDLEHCDPETLVGIARRAVRIIGLDRNGELTDTERAVLCETVDHLLSREAFGRAPFRLQAAATALQCINRLEDACDT